MKKRNTVTADQIDAIVDRTDFKTMTIYGKTTIVTAKLPNGFVIVESSSCVDPDNYDEKIGADICRERIVNKIWELEGYKLQDEFYRKSKERPIEDTTIGELMDLGYTVHTSIEISPYEKSGARVFISDGRGE